jgi:hypothetical protein
MLDYYSKDSSNSSGKNIVRESKSGLFGLERKHRENCKHHQAFSFLAKEALTSERLDKNEGPTARHFARGFCRTYKLHMIEICAFESIGSRYVHKYSAPLLERVWSARVS